MSRKNLNKTQQELFNMWEYICKVCFWDKHITYEGVPYDESWRTFEGFVAANKFRYLRAKVKWRGYKRVAPRTGLTGSLKNNNVKLKRKVKELGYTIENTVFTSPSDQMKYAAHTHKYMFEDRMLGTRDIKNILKKRGIFLTMETIAKRLNSGVPLFDTAERLHIKYKGKWRSYMDIATMESISYDLLKKRIYKDNETLKQAIEYCKNWEGYPTYEFEGKELQRFEIAEIISERTGISKITITGRMKKYGMDMKFITAPIGAKMKKYPSIEVYEVQKTLNLLKEKIKENERPNKKV